MLYALGFLICGGVVVAASVALARHADAIAVATGLGRLWIGTVLLALATSLPEISTDIVAVRLGAADLAVGDLFGSSMANMLILALIDLAMPHQQLLRRATLDCALVACLAIALNASAGLLVATAASRTVLGIGVGSSLLVVMYGLGMRIVLRHSHQAAAATGTPGVEATGRPAELRHALRGFVLAAAVVLIVAPAFAWSAKGLAESSGLGHTFVGTWLVGFSTSLPELVASMAAVRLGAFDLAVGNLFGSNALNMVILFLLDLAAPGGTVTANLDPGHVQTALLAIILMAIGLGTIAYRAERRIAFVEPGSALMVLTYAVGVAILYTHAPRP